jgi:hypothetical protein
MSNGHRGYRSRSGIQIWIWRKKIGQLRATFWIWRGRRMGRPAEAWIWAREMEMGMGMEVEMELVVEVVRPFLLADWNVRRLYAVRQVSRT